MQGELRLKGFFIDDFRHVQQESTENRKVHFKALLDGIYIWFSLLNIALPNLTIYYI